MKQKSIIQKSTTASPGGGPPGVGGTLHRLRKQQDLTLDGLAQRAGVSKSMLSQIERDLTNPTLATVWRLANALGVSLEELVQGTSRPIQRIDLTRVPSTPGLVSADGRCRLRILAPLDLAGMFEWYELITDPYGELRSEPHEPGTVEHLTVLENRLTVESGEDKIDVAMGETARYPADRRHAIVNPTARLARAVLVVVIPGAQRAVRQRI